MIVGFALICGMFFDWLWVECINAVRDHKPFRAANLSLMLYGLTLLATVLVVKNELAAAVAYGIGNWIGTFWAVNKETK